jgi:hypothetical protein
MMRCQALEALSAGVAADLRPQNAGAWHTQRASRHDLNDTNHHGKETSRETEK